MMTDEEEDAASGEMNNWRQFQGTELGSLMSQLYGNKNKPKINYPKPQSKGSLVPSKKFIPGGAKIDAEDPRKVTRRPVNIAVPTRFKEPTEALNPIDIINRRKSADTIKLEIDDIKMRQSHYRPAYVQPISGDAEKERLNQIFTFKGGKGLPQELTHPEGEMPLEVAARRKEEERMDAVRQKKGLGPSAATLRSMKSSAQSYNGARGRASMSVNEQLADQVSREIEERRQHLAEMRELGMIKPDKERALVNEIARKVEELKELMV
jgi:hypothetical protein